MGFFKIIKRLIGGLNLDNTPDDLPKSDYVSGYDVVDRNPSILSEDKYLQPENNNELAYVLSENIDPIDKRYKVRIDIENIFDTNCTITIKFYLKYGPDAWTMAIPYTSGTNCAALYSLIEPFFAGIGCFVSNPTSNGFVLTFNVNMFGFYGYTDYFMSLSDDATTHAQYDTYVLNDAISTEKLGTLVPIEFANVNSAQQIWATPKSKEIENLVATGINKTVPFLDPTLYLVFGGQNALLDGEEIYIYGQGIAVYVCVQATLDPNEYAVYGSAAPYIIASLFPTGNYKVIRNKRRLSTIGYAAKNYLNDTWTYTELVRSINLNFRTTHQIQAYGMITNNGTIYNWTDHLNQIKRLYYFGSIKNQGFLTPYNVDAIYDLDTIGQESRLQLGTNTTKVILYQPTTQTGKGPRATAGAKPEACYAAFVRFKTVDGAYSTFSKASNVVWMRSGSVGTHEYGLNSGRALGILIEQIEYKLFEFAQIGIIEFTTNSWKGYLLPEQPIGTNTSMYLLDTGYNPESYIDFNDAATLVEQIAFVFENAKSILPYNLYEIAANVNIIKERDLSEWAKTITLNVKKEATIPLGKLADVKRPELTTTYINKGINDYGRCTTYATSYMPYDAYRFCVFVDWEDGSPTSTYWVGDVTFDPFFTGINDKVTNWDSVSDDVALNQFFVEASNINLDYVLPNGEYLREIVKDVRFGRALCNQQVYTTGFGMNVFKAAGTPYVSGFNDAVNPQDDVKLVLYSPDFQNTQTLFNYSSGDYLKARNFINDYSTSYTTDNKAVMFTTINEPSPPSYLAVGISNIINVSDQASNNIALFNYNNGASTFPNIYIRDGAAANTTVLFPLQPASNYNVWGFYYIKPYANNDWQNAYDEFSYNTQFFVIPQNKWFNKLTHDSSTIYELYGGDAFPTISAYKIAENRDPLYSDEYNAVVLYYSFNRTNAALRTGRYPSISLSSYLSERYLTSPDTDADRYYYDACFTPRYPFQNQFGFNPNLKQLNKLGSSIFYSEPAASYDLAGGNKVWLPLNRKDLEATYGDIVHMEILLGFSETGLLIVWQPQRTTAQYFDNTANIKTSAGELLIGNGQIMSRKGADFTEYGCEHKWTIRKGQNPTGKDVVFWACFRKGAIMRLGADGTADLVGDINNLLTNRTFLALQNEYNNLDRPAHDYGCHAVWNNQTKEYILTLTLVPKATLFIPNNRDPYAKGDWVYTEDTWGFENIPVFYESLVSGNGNPLTDTEAWKMHSGYDDDAFQIWTMVWNELDNKFKTFRTFNPKIYGQFNNTYVSSHPNYPDNIYEHNKNKNEALFYCTKIETKLESEVYTIPSLNVIVGAGIENLFTNAFPPNARTKYVVKIEGKNYEIVGSSGVDSISMANVDNDDILPEYTFPDGYFIYYICNSQDPYIEGVVNESMPRYVNFTLKNTQADDTLKRVEYYAGYDSLGTVTTQSFTNKVEEEFYNGESNVQIKMDTTNNPTDNEVGENLVEGKWMRFKQFWRWGKKNRVLTTSVAIEETEYKKQ